MKLIFELFSDEDLRLRLGLSFFFVVILVTCYIYFAMCSMRFFNRKIEDSG